MPRRSFFARYAWPILFAFALVAPLLFWGAGRAVLSNTNKVEDWLPRTYRETIELRWFRGHFEADQFVVLSWEGCRLGDDPSDPEAAPDDPRIERLARILRGEIAERRRHPAEAKPYFKSVTTARQVLRQMTGPPSDVPYEEAVRRLKGALIGPDGHQTCVLVTLTLDAIHDLRGAIGRGRDGVLRDRPPGKLWQAVHQAGIDPESVHVGGPPVDNVAIDEEGERTLVRLAGLSGILGIALAWWSLRSIRLTFIVFTCGILSAALGLSVVWFTGSSADAVLMSMPSLVYVLAISGAVHLINYYREAIREGGLDRAPERAIAHGWRPALLCSITTAVGLASLTASELVPIRKFGVYSATGVLAMLLVLFLLLPAALCAWPVRPLRVEDPRRPRRSIAPGGESERGFGRQWTHLAQGIIAHHRWVMAGCLVVIGVVGYGVSRVHTSIDLLRLFDSDARIIEDYAWLERRLGRLVPMEIVLRFPLSTQEADGLRERMTIDGSRELSFLERMETVDLAQEMIESRFGSNGQDIIGATMSAATFGPVLPRGDGGTAEFARRTITNRQLEESRGAFLKSGYLQVEEDGTELWRISVRVAAFENVDYGQFAAELKQAIAPVLAAHQLRSRVLQALTVQREDGATAGASVLLWRPAHSPADDATPVAPPEILETALGQMLSNANVNVLSLHADPAKATDTHLDKLRALDCVVLLGDVGDAQVERITDHGVRTVDARPQALRQRPNGPGAGRDGTQRISAVYTGVVPIVYKAQRALLDSLIDSTMYSFLTITPLMMFVTRSIPAGVVVMLPNVLPVLVVFGGMGWLGISVDIGSMMSASIALGVAVDDTIHFLAWYRDDLKRLGDRRQAIQAAYRKSATPTLQAALISGLGLSVFAFSTFTPTQRFGWLMLTILVAGVVAELIMLPALLAGPLGRVFRVKGRKLDMRAGHFRVPHGFAPREEFHKEEIAKRAAGG